MHPPFFLLRSGVQWCAVSRAQLLLRHLTISPIGAVCHAPLPSHHRPQEDEFWSQDRERVYLVGVSYKNWSSPQEQAAAAAVARARAAGGAAAAAARRAQQFDVHSSLEELGRLADTAGLKVGRGVWVTGVQGTLGVAVS
jgi:hypothetical protein